MRQLIMFHVLGFMFQAIGCASSKVTQLEGQNKRLNEEISKLKKDLDASVAKRAGQIAAEERTRPDRAPREGYPPFDAWGSPFVPPPYVGYTERPPLGWGEAGNEGRSVKFVNDYNPFRRYYLRVFFDGDEVGFTDGVGVYQAVIQTSRAIRPASLLRPNGSSMHIVDTGTHHLFWEMWSGPEPLQYVETCELSVDFDRIRGPWHFFGGSCHKSAPSN